MKIEQVNQGGKIIQEIISKNIPPVPEDLYNYLLDLGAILGSSSELMKYSEFHYKTNPKGAKEGALRVYIQALDKSLHYRIESIRSVLSSVRVDFYSSKHQT